jgi:hypothetical protein
MMILMDQCGAKVAHFFGATDTCLGTLGYMG